MPLYEYKCQLSTGAQMTGRLEAPDLRRAHELLNDMNVQIVSVSEMPAALAVAPLSAEDLRFFNEQIAALARAGVALDLGLRALARDLRRGRLRTLLERLAEDLERGTPFDNAVAARAGLFPPLYVEVLRAGIRSGRLGATLCNMNAHLAMMDSSRRLFWEAAVYPAILLVACFALVTLFSTTLLPAYEDMVRDSLQLAEPIEAFMQTPVGEEGEADFSASLSLVLFRAARYWPTIAWILTALAALVVVAVVGSRYIRPARRWREAVLLAMPGFGGVARLSLLARFAHAAALSVETGQNLAPGLRLAAGATGSSTLTLDADALANRIEGGALPTESAAGLRLLPAIFCFTAQLAGRRGHLPEALRDLARTYDDLARYRLSILRLSLMPAMVLVCGILAGLALLLMFLPLTQVITSLTAPFN